MTKIPQSNVGAIVRWVAVIVSVALCMAPVGASAAESAKAKPDKGLLRAWIDGQVHAVLHVGEETYWQALEAYARRRVVELELAEREPRSFGPWTARKAPEATEADPSGELTEWQEYYYVTHNWSVYGTAILSLVPGDRVEVNGRTMEIRGVFDYPKAAYSDEIWQLVGTDAAVLQTCEPDTELNRIAYGTWLAP